MKTLIESERNKYHKALIESGVLTIDNNGIPSNADKASRISIEISRKMAEALLAESHEKSLGQTSGAKFEQINLEFISSTFPLLQNLRPGNWVVEKTRE